MNQWFKKTYVLVLFVSILFVGLSYGQSGAEAIKGVWLTGSGKAHVKIDKIGNKYFGRIVWLKNPTYEDGTSKIDKNNPDEKMRNTPLLGLRMLKDFHYDEKNNVWEDGTIYDPENGKTYKCKIKKTDKNTLDVRGYIGISAIGRTQVWTRVEK